MNVIYPNTVTLLRTRIATLEEERDHQRGVADEAVDSLVHFLRENTRLRVALEGALSTANNTMGMMHGTRLRIIGDILAAALAEPTGEEPEDGR